MAKRTTTDKEINRLQDDRNRGLIRISAKTLGELALPTFCPRCFWLKRKMRNELPFRQPLPGAFSSIDSITKQVVHGHFDEHGRLPPWLAPLGDIVCYHEPPHWSRFNSVIEEHGILLTGVADGIFQWPDGSFIIVDYKTARFTSAQDALLPMYEVQLNAYALIAERCGFGPVVGLALVYLEPTINHHGGCEQLCQHAGLRMPLNARIVNVERNTDMLGPLLARARALCDRTQRPPRRTPCPDCRQVRALVEVEMSDL